MAKDGIGGIVTIAAVGGLGYWLYSSGMLSSLFGSSAPAPVSTPPGTNPVASPIPSAPAAAPATPAAPPPCSGAGILPVLLSNVQKLPNGSTYGPNLPGTFTIDEWGYYLNQLCTGMADQYKLNADALFPGKDDRGGPLNWSAFSGYAQQAGLSGLCTSGMCAAPAWSGVSPSALPPGLRRTLPAKARAMGRRTAPRTIGTHLVRRAA